MSLRRTVPRAYDVYFRDLLKMLIDSNAQELWDELNENPASAEDSIQYLNAVHSVFR